MKQNKEIIFYTILIFLGIIGIGLIIYNDKTNNNLNTTVKEDNNGKEQVIEDNNPNKILEEEKEEKQEANNLNKEEDKVNNNNNQVNNNVTSYNKTNNSTSNNNNNNNNDDSKEELSINDQNVINELNNIATKTDELLMEGNDESILDKAKGVFITLVDFCFYDGEIKGITFNELTTTGQEKVLKIVNNIDQKIENKFPGYKEKISTKTKSAFNKASELIKKGANNIKDFAQSKLGEDNYQAIIEEKDELVKYTKNAWDIVKNVSSNIWSSTKSKLKSWYEKFRENNK